MYSLVAVVQKIQKKGDRALLGYRVQHYSVADYRLPVVYNAYSCVQVRYVSDKGTQQNMNERE